MTARLDALDRRIAELRGIDVEVDDSPSIHQNGVWLLGDWKLGIRPRLKRYQPTCDDLQAMALLIDGKISVWWNKTNECWEARSPYDKRSAAAGDVWDGDTPRIAICRAWGAWKESQQ